MGSAEMPARHGNVAFDGVGDESDGDAYIVGNVGDHSKRAISGDQYVLDPGVAVSLLTTKRHLQPAVGAADAAIGIDFLRKAVEEHATSKPSKARGELAHKPSKWDARSKMPLATSWLAKLEQLPQGVHSVLSMTPVHMVAAATEAVEKISPVKLPKQADVVDMFTVKTWTTMTYTKLGIGLSAILLLVVQSFAAGDFALGSCKGRDERGLPQESTWPAAEPASVFTLGAQSLLCAAAAAGRAEIRGPADCPPLRAATSADRRGQLMRIGLASSADPLMTLGPVRCWRTPEVLPVQRTSTGVIDYLEPLEPGRWALRRDGHTELLLKCDPWQRSVEVRALVQTHTKLQVSPKLEEFEIDEAEDDDDEEGSKVLADATTGEALRPGGQRLIARATLKSFESAGGALSSDSIEIAIAAGEEAALPLSCIVGALLMSPDILDVRASGKL